MSSMEFVRGRLQAASAVDLSLSSSTSSPLELSGVVGTETAGPSSSTSVSMQSPEHQCPDCPKMFKSRSGLTRHKMLHKLNDCTSRMPVEENIQARLPELFIKVLAEITNETAVSGMGMERRRFLEALSSNQPSSEFSLLCCAISKPIVDCVLDRVKVMPSGQYEEALKKMNFLLSSAAFYDDVKPKILACVPSDFKNVSEAVMQRLVWRISSKLMLYMQESIFVTMRKTNQMTYEKYKMNEEEEEVFKEHISDMLRAVYSFGAKCNNVAWKLRCRSMRERFIEVDDEISREQFVNIELWKNNSITLSETAVKYFLGIEKVIQSYQEQNSSCSFELIFNSLCSADNLLLLDYVRELTHGVLSEKLALDFMYDLVRNQTNLSGQLDARRKTAKASKSQKTSVVSLRTNLKRNPVTCETEVGPEKLHMTQSVDSVGEEQRTETSGEKSGAGSLKLAGDAKSSKTTDRKKDNPTEQKKQSTRISSRSTKGKRSLK